MNDLLKKLLKLIFIKKTISTNRFNNKLFSSLHTIWLPIAIAAALLDTLDVIDSLTSISIILIHFILIIRNINPLMFKKKEKISVFANNLLRYSLLIFIFNVFVFTWSFAFGFFFLSVIGRLLYVELPNVQENMKKQEEFKQQFGEYDGNINEKAITAKHIENLFNKELSLDQIDEKILKKQFRDMAKLYHPDKNNGEHDDKFHSIKQSYDFLREKIKA